MRIAPGHSTYVGKNLSLIAPQIAMPPQPFFLVRAKQAFSNEICEKGEDSTAAQRAAATDCIAFRHQNFLFSCLHVFLLKELRLWLG
jgi:hypothetical protein